MKGRINLKGGVAMRKRYIAPQMSIIRFEVNLVTDGCCDVSY